MTKELKDKVAIVTGASRGIGREIAKKLAAAGALVAVHYGGSEAAANKVVEDIEASGGKAFAVQTDLSRPGAAGELFEALDRELTARTGSNRFDILVNNAAIAPFLALADTQEAEFDRIIAVNVRAPYFIAQKAAERLNDEGRIVNFSSVATRLPVTEAAAYSISKGPIEVLTRILAAELGSRGITANAVAPGVIETDMAATILSPESEGLIKDSQTIKRIGQADDVGDLVAYLASPAARWVTGQVIEASGGTRVVY